MKLKKDRQEIKERVIIYSHNYWKMSFVNIFSTFFPKKRNMVIK